MFMVLSSCLEHGESSPGSRDECYTAPGGSKPVGLSHKLACRLPVNYPPIVIHYYSARKLIFILPSHGG